MQWPIATDYQEAVQNPPYCFGDVELKAGKPRLDKLGMPRPISGAFASVYQLETPTGRWAVRCFLKHIEDHQRRYAAISGHLRTANLKSAVGFEYLAQGIRVRAEWFPILKMEWVDGEPLNTYIAKNLGQPSRLMQLAREWNDLMASLRAARIAHGDLQHGNVLVTPTGLRLIDYDGMYVPALDGMISHEDGHRNYQHPQRTGHDFGPHLDNFSAWVIFCSISCFALDPQLWHTLDSGDECLLFRREDFQRPDQSKVFKTLSGSRQEVKQLAAQFRTLLSMPLRHVPALDGQTVSPPGGRRQGSGSGQLPDWMANHSPVPPKIGNPLPDDNIAAVVTAADWIIDHLVDRQSSRPTLRHHSFTIERLALLLTCYLTGVSAWAISVNLLAAAPGIAVIAVTICIFTAMLVARYRTVSGIPERRRAAAELRASRARLEQHLSQIASADRTRRQTLAPLDALRKTYETLPQTADAELRALRAGLDTARGALTIKKQDFDVEQFLAVQVVQQDANQRAAPLRSELAVMDQREQAALLASLTALQETYVRNLLTYATIGEASLSGIGPKLKERLRDNGILSAFDVEFWRVRNIEGIGDAKAAQLVGWRDAIVHHASMPTSVPPDEASKIRLQFAARRRALDQQIRAIHDTEQRQVKAIADNFDQQRIAVDDDEHRAIQRHDAGARAINARLQQERHRVDREYQSLRATLGPQRREHDERLAELNQQTMRQRLDVCKFERELDRFLGLSPGRYLRSILRFRRSKVGT